MNTTNITVNTQSSIRIAGSKILYFDPFQITEEPHDADIIFITHAHYDHLDPESIDRAANKNKMTAADKAEFLEKTKQATISEQGVPWEFMEAKILEDIEI